MEATLVDVALDVGADAAIAREVTEPTAIFLVWEVRVCPVVCQGVHLGILFLSSELISQEGCDASFVVG